MIYICIYHAVTENRFLMSIWLHKKIFISEKHRFKLSFQFFKLESLCKHRSLTIVLSYWTINNSIYCHLGFFYILPKCSTINMSKNNTEYFFFKISNFHITYVWFMRLKISFSCSNIMFLIPLFFSIASSWCANEVHRYSFELKGNIFQSS